MMIMGDKARWSAATGVVICCRFLVRCAICCLALFDLPFLFAVVRHALLCFLLELDDLFVPLCLVELERHNGDLSAISIGGMDRS